MADLSLKNIMAGLLTAAICAGGNLALAAEGTGPRPLPTTASQFRDVRLQGSGSIELQLVDAQGRGMSDVAVAMKFQNRTIASASTNQDGIVVLEKIRPGIHTIHAGGGTEVVRVWSTAAAPPSAVNRLAIVSEERIVRGQTGLPMNFAGAGFSPLNVLTVASLAGAGVAFAETQSQQNEIDRLNSQLQALASP